MTEVMAPAFPTLEELLGIRSFRPTFYPEYRQAEEGLARAIRALEGVSVELSRIADQPQQLAARLVSLATVYGTTAFHGKRPTMANENVTAELMWAPDTAPRA